MKAARLGISGPEEWYVTLVGLFWGLVFIYLGFVSCIPLLELKKMAIWECQVHRQNIHPQQKSSLCSQRNRIGPPKMRKLLDNLLQPNIITKNMDPPMSVKTEWKIKTSIPKVATRYTNTPCRSSVTEESFTCHSYREVKRPS